MKRKVIQLAGKTYVVSLPLAWAKRNSIQKGCEVEVVERTSSLTILSPGAKDKEVEITLHVKKNQKIGKRQLADLYIRGYDEVKIFAEFDQLEKLKEEDLLGFEIVDEKKDFVHYKNVAEGDSFDVMLRRTFLLLKQMSELVLEESNEKTILSMEKTTNKFTNYCKRILFKQGYTPHYRLIFLYVLVKDLEVIGDYYKYLVQDTKTISQKGKSFFKEISEFFEVFYQLFYTHKQIHFEKLRSDKEVLLERGKKLLKIDPIPAHYGLTLITAIYNLLGPYTQMYAGEVYDSSKKEKA